MNKLVYELPLVQYLDIVINRYRARE